jgi:hypothetical protein
MRTSGRCPGRQRTPTGPAHGRRLLGSDPRRVAPTVASPIPEADVHPSPPGPIAARGASPAVLWGRAASWSSAVASTRRWSRSRHRAGRAVVAARELLATEIGGTSVIELRSTLDEVACDDGGRAIARTGCRSARSSCSSRRARRGCGAAAGAWVDGRRGLRLSGQPAPRPPRPPPVGQAPVAGAEAGRLEERGPGGEVVDRRPVDPDELELAQPALVDQLGAAPGATPTVATGGKVTRLRPRAPAAPPVPRRRARPAPRPPGRATGLGGQASAAP